MVPAPLVPRHCEAPKMLARWLRKVKTGGLPRMPIGRLSSAHLEGKGTFCVQCGLLSRARGLLGSFRMIASFDAPPQSDPASRHTILVVEDEVLVRLDIAGYLRSKDFTVLEAGNAHEAMQLLNADPNIDLVFSDVSMPGNLNGIELARWIRAERNRVRVLLTSGTANNIQIASRENVVVEKPYHPGDVEMNIRRLLGT